MPLEQIPYGIEPENADAPIWRFMDLRKFKDLVSTNELYFCRADLFEDEQEGMPPDEIHFGSYPLGRNDALGCNAQFREDFYINCWHLFAEETAMMWHLYGNEGVAVSSHYSSLKSEVAKFADKTFLGMVHYGYKHMDGKNENVILNITTKREKFKDEREVRAFLWIPNPYAGINRHYDEHNVAHPRPLTPPSVPEFQRRKVNIQSLITEVVVSPCASEGFISEIERLVKESGHSIPVQPSDLTRYRDLLPYTA
jgi:hypothetical protein